MPALAERMSTLPASLTKRSIARSSSRRLAMSATRTTWSPTVTGGNDSTICSSASRVRASRPTRAPLDESRSARARQVPGGPPVTIAVVPGTILTRQSFHAAPWAPRSRRLTSTQMAHDHATVAEEEYLQTMFWLEEAGLQITGANIARAMQLSPPTVHEMIGRLESDGYVSRAEDKRLSFTDEGRVEAQAIVRRHRIIERFLTDVLGVPWDEVHEEAERLEHAMSPVLEERMLAAIGDAKTCPHGHPIVEGAREEGVLLADVEPGADVRVLRFENEAEEILHYLKGTGLHPGLDGKLESSDAAEIVVASGDGKHPVSKSVAKTVSVRAEPAPPSRPPLPEQLVVSSDRYGR